MKNKTTVFMIALLLLSIAPMAFAQDDDADDKGNSNNRVLSGSQRQLIMNEVKEDIEEWRVKRAEQIAEKVESAGSFIGSLSENQSRIFLHLSRAQQNRLVEMDDEDALEAINSFRLRVINKTEAFKKRVIAEEKLKHAEQNYLKAKQNYLKSLNSYEEAKSDFMDVKNRIKECTDEDSEECNELRERAENHSREMIINSANMVIEHLNKIKEKIISSETMDEERAEKIILEIEGYISEVDGIIEDAESAETKDEIKEAASSLSKLWIKIRNRERLHSAAVVEAQVWGIMKRSEHLEERLESTLAKMKEQGLDVSGIDDKVTEFSEKIAQAKAKYEEAQELIDNEYFDDDKETPKSIVDEAKELINEAHELLKEAHEILVDIVKEIRSAGGEIEPEDDDEEYEVVEEDDDDEEEEEEEDGEDDDENNEEEDDDEEEEDEED